MNLICVILMHHLYIAASGYPYKITRGQSLPIVTREEWGAKPATEITPLKFPAPMVVIHHSSSPSACYTTDECKQAMRSMQSYHQNDQKWADIGYNFAVGGDGLIYEGRSWDKVGAHAAGYNNASIGIVLIGHWVSELPPEHSLQATEDLINFGVESGYINPQYKLVGHRQLGTTECPGDKLYDEIESWNNYDPITYRL